MSKDQADRIAELITKGWKTVTVPPGSPVGGDVSVVDPAGKMWVVRSDGMVAFKG